VATSTAPTQTPVRHTRHQVIAAALCFLAAAGVRLSISPLFGAPLAEVHVIWRDVPEDERRSLERQLQLSEARQLGRNEWSYVPLDTAPPRLRALVTHPAVERTNGVDRSSFRMSSRAPLTERRGGRFPGHPNAARAAKLVSYLLAASGLMVLALTSVVVRRRVTESVSRVRASPADAARDAAKAAITWIQRGVPVASPEAAGAFRIVFVSLLLLFVVSSPARDIALDTPGFADARGIQRVVTSWLAAEHARIVAIDWVLLSSAVFAIVGFLTRTSFAVFVTAFLLWACVVTLDTTHHVLSALMWILPSLLAAPWGDAWSVDAWWRQRRQRELPAPSQRYGYTFWIPGFVYGVAMLAAAWAKVGGGPDWVLNGTVKYHFVSDLPHAWVSWGPMLTKSHLVAVVLSAIAVVIEGTLIVASFTRSAGVRLAFGVTAMTLLIGFALFQGIVWKAWWIALTSFLPWQLIGSRSTVSSAPTPVAFSAIQVIAVVALVVQQTIASAAKLEVRPFITAYDMYSGTYASPEDYEFSTNLDFRVVALRSGTPADVPDCVFDDHTVERIEAAAAPMDRLARELQVHGGSCRDLGPDVTAVLLEGDRQVFDWDRSQFTTKRRVRVVGPIQFARPR
jgi:hypothetical protein